MANIEVHSQESPRKLFKCLKALPFASEIFITIVASSCVNVATRKDAPFLRIYYTDDDPLPEILEALKPIRNTFDIEIMPKLNQFLPKLE